MMARGVFLAAGLVLFALPGLIAPALAAPRDDVRAGSGRCDAIADDRAWLDCYYGAAQPMRAKLGLPPAPATQTLLVPPPVPGATPPSVAARSAPPEPPDEVDNFFQQFLSHKNVKAEAPTRMTSYTFDRAGFFTVTLANGEVWKQSTVDIVQAKWKAKPATYVVTIVPGPKMNVGPHETYQVERVR
jgi:hypothetical protein